LPSGRKISGRADFFLGAADMPIDPPADWKPDALNAKIAAGAQFAQTQFCMDAQVLRRYMARLNDNGIPEKLSMIIGVVPLRSAKSALWIKQHLFGSIIPEATVKRMEQATDPAREGKAILVEYLEEIATIPGVAGAHIMAPNHDEAVPEVIAEIRRRNGW
jgi:methylenetetrahydrofolate reductase (NADPH)